MDDQLGNPRAVAMADRRAAAFAEFTTMQNDLAEAQAKIASLEKDLGRAQDTLALVAEERKTYRDDSLLYRSKLVELATSMSNIGMLTTKAQEIMMTIGPLIAAHTRQQEDQDGAEAAAIISRLPASGTGVAAVAAALLSPPL